MTGASPHPPDRVRVLLSTHNGSRYLRQQIDSVLNQRDVQVSMTIRDDGSGDETLDILSQYAGADARVSYVAGERMGAAQSYLKILSETADDIDYVALCDQDDVWIDGKLAQATAWLSDTAGPAMYCSAIEVVDDNLQPIGIHRTCRRGPALENALVQNIATGCTIVLNQPALRLFRRVPVRPVMHDWWIYAVISATGTVRYDPSTWVLYRQHAGNSIGVATSQPKQWIRRLKQNVAAGNERARSRQAAELVELLGSELGPKALATLTQFIGAQATIARRVGYALTGPAFRQRTVDDVVYRALCVLGRI